jgi:hypothetical protein
MHPLSIDMQKEKRILYKTQKIGCPAKIYLKEVMFFQGYKVILK